jgi:hypothetical protein
MALHLEALWGIVFCVIIVLTMLFFVMKIPGGLGMLLGFFTSMIFTITDTIWSIIGPLILPIFNTFKNAVNFGTAMGITMFAAPLIIRGITWVASQIAARYSMQGIAAASARAAASAGAVQSIGVAGGRGIISSLKSLGSSLGKAFQGAAVAAVIILATDFFIQPTLEKIGGPWLSNSVGGMIEGGTTGYFVGPGIATALGPALITTLGSSFAPSVLGTSIGLGPAGLIIGLPSGLVATVVKNNLGMKEQGTVGALVTIGSAAATGAAMGALLAPATLGVSIVVGAAIGAVVGAFQWFFG